ncbi:MAG: hypothetical protein Q9M97_03410 [Candidatus Gracilibacteria bacterium]|nr:hypothetical protein [Candidatus Gracilibacteria bacterium]
MKFVEIQFKVWTKCTFIEANRVVDQVRDISRYTLQMNFIKVEDMAKLGKKCNEKITVEDLKNLIIVKIILKLRQGKI